MKAAGYFRLYAHGDGDTLSRQQRHFLDYCEEQGYEVAATFSEDGRSEDQQAFGRLIDYLKQPEKGFVVVVAQQPAVLADDPNARAGRFLEVERLGATVHFIEAEKEPLEAIMESWSAEQAAPGERVRAAMHRKAVRGEVLGRPPYGYRVGAKNRLEVIQEEAVVVRYIFRLYLHEGIGIRLIARRLNEEGLRTRRNQPWSMVTIRDILRNRVYLGTYQRLGVRVPGTHPALVSPDDFRRVQERLGDRRTNYKTRSVAPFLLSGLLVCGECGSRLIGVSRHQSWKRRSDGAERKASYRYYQCESRTNQGLCGYHTQRAEDIEARVKEKLETLEPQELGTTGNDAAVLAEWKAVAERLRERLHQIDRKIGKTFETAAVSGMSADRLRGLSRGLAEDRVRTDEDLRAAEWRAEHYASANERRRGRFEALSKLRSRWDTLPMAEAQELLRDLVDRIVVSGKDVRIYLRP